MNTKRVSWRRWKSNSALIESENRSESEKLVSKIKASNCWMSLWDFMKRTPSWKDLLKKSQKKSKRLKTRLRRKSKPYKKCTSSLQLTNAITKNSTLISKRSLSIRKERRKSSMISTKKVLKQLVWSRNTSKTFSKKSTLMLKWPPS